MSQSQSLSQLTELVLVAAVGFAPISLGSATPTHSQSTFQAEASVGGPSQQVSVKSHFLAANVDDEAVGPISSPTPAAVISVGTHEGDPGDTGIIVPISLESLDGAQIVGLNFDLSFDDSRLYVADVITGAAALAADKSISWSIQAAGNVRLLISGLNQNEIGDGVVATVSFDVHLDAAVGSFPLALANAYAADPDGSGVTSNVVDGLFTIGSLTEIFSDGFESGDTTAWSGVNAGGGDLTVCPGAVMDGTGQGLCISVTTNKRKQVWDDTVSDATRYRARFYFDPNGLSMGNNEKIRIAQTRTGSDLIRPFIVQLRKFSGQYQIRARAQDDDFDYDDTAWYTISNSAHAIEVDWQASSAPAADDGTLTLYLDGVLKQTLTGIDSDTEVVNTLKMGFTSRLGDKNISGTFYMDEFVSDSDAYIGP